MIDFHTRFLEGDLEVRSDGRTVAGIACPYNEPTPIREWGISYTESFAQGAFAEAIANPGKVRFLSQHQRQSQPLGKTMALRDDARGLYGEFRFSNTQAGNDALELVRDQAIDGFSVGFQGISPANNEIRNGANVVRTSVKLNEVSLVTFPAYDGARVGELRSEDVQHLAELLEWARSMELPAPETKAVVEQEITRAFRNDPRTRAAAARLARIQRH